MADFKVSSLVVVPQELQKHFVLDQIILLNNLDIGLRFFLQIDLGNHEGAHPIAGL